MERIIGGNMEDALGDRMKMLEAREAGRRTLPLLPICARLDGKCFSKFTKGLHRPFDLRMQSLMLDVTLKLVEETNACIGYTQSDEISLIYYSSTYASQVFFDGKIQKMVSVLASMATAHFNKLVPQYLYLEEKKDELAYFDCRVWDVPTKEEAVNTILWRELDATKNAISMAARTVYSHKELMHKTCSEMQEMLFQKGINFNDYPSFFKRGAFVQRKDFKKVLTDKELAKMPEKYANEIKGKEITRSEVVFVEVPPFNKVINRVEFIFDGDIPEVIKG